MQYRVKWKEIRLEADDEYEAIEKAKECEYEETASDESWYD